MQKQPIQQSTEFMEAMMEKYRCKPEGMTDLEFCRNNKIRKYQLDVFKQVLAENFRRRVMENTPRIIGGGGGEMTAAAKRSIRAAMCLVKGCQTNSWTYEFEDFRHQILYNMCIIPCDKQMVPVMERFLKEMEEVYGR